MIIGISGKTKSGKDTVGRIIQYLTSDIKDTDFTRYCEIQNNNEQVYKEALNTTWQIHKFADALKDIVCILTGCTREQLEDIDFKNSKLHDSFIRYGYADGFIKEYIGNGEMGNTKMINKQCSKEEYEEHYKINWQTAYKVHPTYREILQYIGTDLLRNQLNENIWVNALFKNYYIEHYLYGNTPYVLQPNGNYRPAELHHSGMTEQDMINLGATKVSSCNWVVTDVRFPNEAIAIKDRGGILIRVNRFNSNQQLFDQHPSETSLDDYPFDYTISNNSTIEELIEQVKVILIKEKII